MLAVHGHGYGRSRRRDRPACLDGESLRVDGHDIVLLFVVVVNHPLAIGDREFHPAAQVHGLHYGSLGGIDDRRVLAVAVKAEDELRCRIVNNRVGVRITLDLASDFEGLRIENEYLLSIPIRDESLTEISHDDDAMASL